MKRVIKKFLVPIILLGIISVAIPTSVYARTHYFNYELGVALRGKTNYNLTKAQTYVYSTANTYHRSNNKVTNPKLNYRYELGKYKKNATANGWQTTLNCGRINAGSYKINVYVTSDNFGYSRYIKGNGRIAQ